MNSILQEYIVSYVFSIYNIFNDVIGTYKLNIVDKGLNNVIFTRKKHH